MNSEEESKTLTPEKWSGKSLTLLAEICSSWGFSGKKAMMSKIADHLMKDGYQVKYTVKKVKGSTGIVRITLIKDDGTKEVIFSNEKKDTEQGAILGFSISSKEKEILAKLEST